MKRSMLFALAAGMLLLGACDYIPPDVGIVPGRVLPVTPEHDMSDAERVFSSEETALYPLSAFISSAAADLKEEADARSQTLTQLVSGSEITIRSASGEWYGANAYGLSGFIRIDAVRAAGDRPAAQKREAGGLVNIRAYLPDLRTELLLAREGIWGAPIYPVNVCALAKRTVDKLSAVKAELESAGLGLKVLDAYRDRPAQARLMSRSMSHVEINRGAAHRTGAAVDVTLTDRLGKNLPMPTLPYEHGALESPGSANNARILRDAMQKHGFIANAEAWWHFEDADASIMGLKDTAMAEFLP